MVRTVWNPPLEFESWIWMDCGLPVCLAITGAARAHPQTFSGARLVECVCGIHSGIL